MPMITSELYVKRLADMGLLSLIDLLFCQFCSVQAGV